MAIIDYKGINMEVPRKGVSGELLEGEDEEKGVSLVPSAPPAHMSLSAVLDGDGDLLSLEPPTWVPDSHATSCNRCKAGFRWVPMKAFCIRSICSQGRKDAPLQDDCSFASLQAAVTVLDACNLPRRSRLRPSEWYPLFMRISIAGA